MADHDPPYRPTDLQTYRPTDLQTYRPTDLQTYRPTDLQTYRPASYPPYELKDFRRAAADGRVQIWGKRHNGKAFEPIEKAYWRVHTFEWLGLLKGKTITERADGGRRDTSTEYLDLMTSETQVEALWPS
jgi:hypothetical protein